LINSWHKKKKQHTRERFQWVILHQQETNSKIVSWTYQQQKEVGVKFPRIFVKKITHKYMIQHDWKTYRLMVSLLQELGA
jgi:urease accessory protein UreE